MVFPGIIILFNVIVHIFGDLLRYSYLPLPPVFEDPKNWETFPPCEIDTIKFPTNFDSVIKLPSSIQTNGLILPNDGIIFIPISFNLKFSDKVYMRPTNCKNDDYIAVYKKPFKKYWFNSDTWKKFPPIDEKNLAIPHLEKIPCANEDIVIRSINSLSIDIENVVRLYAGSFQVEHYEMRSTEIERLFHTKVGQVMFTNGETTRVRYVAERMCGCHHQDEVVEYEQRVCEHQFAKCNLTKCKEPIYPTGHCCPLCGALLHIYLHNCNAFDMKHFHNKIESEVKLNNLENVISFHISMVSEGEENYVQLIIIDNNDYKEDSVQFIRTLNRTFLRPNFHHFTQIFHISRVARDLRFTYSAGWLFVCATFLFMAVFFSIIYLHYSTNYSPLNWIPFYRHGIFNSPFVFARFNNSRNSVDANNDDIGVDVGYRLNEEISSATTVTSGGTTSFNNPMFNDQESSVLKAENFQMIAESSNLPLPVDIRKELMEVNLRNDSFTN